MTHKAQTEQQQHHFCEIGVKVVAKEQLAPTYPSTALAHNYYWTLVSREMWRRRSATQERVVFATEAIITLWDGCSARPDPRERHLYRDYCAHTTSVLECWLIPATNTQAPMETTTEDRLWEGITWRQGNGTTTSSRNTIGHCLGTVVARVLLPAGTNTETVYLSTTTSTSCLLSTFAQGEDHCIGRGEDENGFGIVTLLPV